MTLTRLILFMLAVLLLGYAFIDRGFAYVGFYPIFIGEIVLAVMLVTTLITGTNIQFFGSVICQALLVFMAWETFILVTNMHGTWMNALRDSVTWSYSLYSLLIAGLLLRARALGLTVNWYGRWMPWFIFLSAPLFVISDRFGNVLPAMPGTDVPFLNVKGGDYGVHLAGAAAFMALGLHREFPGKKGNWFGMKDVIYGAFLMLGIIAAGSRNRGGLLSVVLALFVVFALRPNNRFVRLLVPATALMILLGALDVSIPTGGGREISTSQILENVESVIGDNAKQNLSGTVNWRLEWWDRIIESTIYGDGFWRGVGYGQSLAAKYGFKDATGNRSPHNGHLTILARSGVPGAVLWIVFILTTYAVLLREYVNANVAKQVTLAKINLWVMAYFTAFLVNMSFDVFLEGPQGGIWFWSLVGFAIALTRAERVNRTAAQENAGARQYGAAPVSGYTHARNRRPV